MEKTYFLMNDLGGRPTPIFGNTHILGARHLPFSMVYSIHPGKLTAGTQSHGGLVQMIFLFNQVIFRFQPLILRSIIQTTSDTPSDNDLGRPSCHGACLLAGTLSCEALVRTTTGAPRS